MLLSEVAVGELQHSPIREDVMNQQYFLDLYYKEHIEGGKAESLPWVTKEAFAWAIAVTNSRSFGLRGQAVHAMPGKRKDSVSNVDGIDGVRNPDSQVWNSSHAHTLLTHTLFFPLGPKLSSTWWTTTTRGGTVRCRAMMMGRSTCTQLARCENGNRFAWPLLSS